jgi:preprotein translocase subunit SecE
MKYQPKLLAILKGSMAEMKKITWPTRQETVKYTITIIVICIVVAMILGSFDLFYRYLMEQFII